MDKPKCAGYCLSFSRDKIPFSNIEKITIEIETGHLPDEFVYAVGALVDKYEEDAEYYCPPEFLGRDTKLNITKLEVRSLVSKPAKE